jgi:hypothetical protein
MVSLSVDMRPRVTEPPPRQSRERRRYASLSAEESGRDHDADPRDHDPDLGDQSADPGDHDAPIRAITMRRSSRSRWRVTRTREALRADFPELASRIDLQMPGEKEKRHGQAMAAASLSALKVSGVSATP